MGEGWKGLVQGGEYWHEVIGAKHEGRWLRPSGHNGERGRADPAQRSAARTCEQQEDEKKQDQEEEQQLHEEEKQEQEDGQQQEEASSVLSSKFRSTQTTLMRIRTLNYTFAMDPSLPEFQCA